MAIMAGVVLVAASGWLPIVASAIVGCVLMALAGCITLNEAYRAIEWRVIFLLGGILSLGLALDKTGAAHRGGVDDNDRRRVGTCRIALGFLLTDFAPDRNDVEQRDCRFARTRYDCHR